MHGSLGDERDHGRRADGASGLTLGERLRAVRADRFGPDGIEVVAERLGLAPQVWQNVEQVGELLTAPQLRAFIELTGVEPLWLLQGEGPRYRLGTGPPDDGSPG